MPTKPLKKIISEEEFLEIFQKQTTEILKICSYLKEKSNKDFLYTKRFYGTITTQSRILEDFLDDYGAKNNRTWIFFRELIDSARYMGFSCYMIQHIQNRYTLYDLKDPDNQLFQEQTIMTQDFLNSAIRNVFTSIRNEAQTLGLKSQHEPLKEENFLDIASNKMLPHNLDDGFSLKEEENVVKIASDYLNIMQDHEDFKIDRPYSIEEIESLMPEYISEEKLRRFELRIHNLQSLYDTYIKDTKIETENPALNSMRGCISIALHLAEIATALTHFYERHESELRHETVRDKIESLIDKKTIMNLIVNYCLFHCYSHLEKGNGFAKDFLKSYVVIDAIRIPIPIYMGFHVRPATLVMKIVNHYGSEVTMKIDDERYDASSALDLFRANEKISAKKRQLILKEIQPYTSSTPVEPHEVAQIILRELNRLLKEGKLISYEDITTEDITYEGDQGSVKAQEIKPLIAEQIKRLMIAGKIDIRMDVLVTFKGDQRALKDIEALAHANYGEDEKGNNVELPPEIAYLRR
jgi:hypothetical protein